MPFIGFSGVEGDGACGSGGARDLYCGAVGGCCDADLVAFGACLLGYDDELGPPPVEGYGLFHKVVASALNIGCAHTGAGVALKKGERLVVGGDGHAAEAFVYSAFQRQALTGVEGDGVGVAGT